MALLQDLIQQIDDPILRERILQETDKLIEQKKFGLVFEEHLPECTPLYSMPIRVGSKVALKTGYVSDIYTVLRIDGDNTICDRRETHEQKTFRLDEIVVVAEFGEPIYPTLTPIDAVENAPDSDLWHTLIEADNYHALQLLEYLYAGKVDCIYIDPPYNTGAKDWKYNNDYVDGNDQYRHSKWLSMMEKRLRLAKKLLNPTDSVLIATIDEKEYLHLGCLLEEIFKEAKIQMISAMTNKKGSTRPGQFSRAGEYFFYVFMGNHTIEQVNDNMLLSNDEDDESEQTITIWNSLLRRGTAALRSDRPNLFYPIYVDKETHKILYVGDSLALEENRNNIPWPSTLPSSAVICWPLRKNNVEGRWQVGQDTLRKRMAEHRVKAGQFNATTQQCSIVMLKDKQMEQIENGLLEILGTDDSGAYVVAQKTGDFDSVQNPRTIWVRDRHDASVYGSTMLRNIIGGQKFTFPKSLYAVHDCINFSLKSKTHALILDFFSGSGTTLHAVNLLNAEDGGHRRCIMVTNNEVSADEATALTAQGYQPGDEEWEKLGIARYVNWPRTVCSIEGHDINGNPLSGNYFGSDIPMSDGFKANAAFFKLSFLDKTSVALGKQFAELLPVLWMKGRAIGKCPVLNTEELPPMLLLPENKMAVLIDETFYSEFDNEIRKYSEIQTIFIVTDSETAYREMIRNYDGKDCYQLYRDYLDNFRINTGR
ncbi:site-specific DNA-methyltransferase [Acutalibacter sp. 1XD8-33]|uniref:site-specific DNA-methyltransferase n=1 Tax=Acutalibacter sp. 1XD8-33 TaxID=2320081 RepID=UPI000EA1989C|nr:DNA methyltransferase [Acutalibacter sp. 1XD8-33]RKJ41596.1 site-specific DNA-methyltransferase [Acutalibacter sp. 1XD8-33]